MKQRNLLQGEIYGMVFLLERDGRFVQERTCVQHGTATLMEHSIQVTCLSLKIADWIKLPIDRSALMRGALLHDYFLYDWHTSNDGHDLHAFTHPGTALKNAMADFTLTETEKNVIARHMFPLTPIPPTTSEGWIVCIADKICAARETIAPFLTKYRRDLAL